MDELLAVLNRIADRRHHHRHPHLTGGKFVITIPDNTPDGTYSFDGVEAKDEEGAVIATPDLTFEISITDDTVFSVTPNADPSTGGSYHVGAPGLASVEVHVKRTSDGLEVGTFGEQFTVHTGPVATASGKISFSGLTPDP